MPRATLDLTTVEEGTAMGVNALAVAKIAAAAKKSFAMMKVEL